MRAKNDGRGVGKSHLEEADGVYGSFPSSEDDQQNPIARRTIEPRVQMIILGKRWRRGRLQWTTCVTCDMLFAQISLVARLAGIVQALASVAGSLARQCKASVRKTGIITRYGMMRASKSKTLNQPYNIIPMRYRSPTCQKIRGYVRQMSPRCLGMRQRVCAICLFKKWARLS